MKYVAQEFDLMPLQQSKKILAHTYQTFIQRKRKKESLTC